MGLSDFNSGGGTINAPKLVDALYRAIIKLSELESKANRDNTASQTNFVQFSITGDATKTFAATLNLPARMIKDTAGKIELKARNFIVDYIDYEPGTGDLVEATSLPEAIVLLCRLITYLERQIDPNIVITTPNQVSITDNNEAGSFDIQVNLPLETVEDETTGQIAFNMFDYLFVLDAQAN
jgi:hypothetical protein